MAFSLQDFVRGIDMTGIDPATAADLNDLVDLSSPISDTVLEGKGIILWSKDTAPDTPIVPDAATNVKWKRYIWIRIPYLTVDDQTPKIYAWNDNGPISFVTNLWQQIIPDTASLQAAIDAVETLANTALLNANAAQVTAANANTNAATALTNANAALVTANSASAAAQAAGLAAASAQSTANAAQTTANEALVAATAPKAPGDGISPGTSFQQIRTNRAGTAAEWFTPVDNYVKFNEQYAKNTDAPNAVIGANVRQFNTEVHDTGGLASVLAGVITLATGTWYVRAKYASRGGEPNQGFLIKDSDNSLLLEGDTDWINASGSSNQVFGEVCGIIVLAAATGVRVDHYFANNQNKGQGLASNVGPGGSHEIYATFEAWRIG